MWRALKGDVVRSRRQVVSVTTSRETDDAHCKAIVTVLLAVTLVLAYSMTRQPGWGMAFRWGAVPCELHRGQPLGGVEVAQTVIGNHTACSSELSDQRLNPEYFPAKQVYTALITFQFVHRDLEHFILNFLLLLVIGLSLETGTRLRPRSRRILFPAFLLLLYLASGAAAALVIAGLYPDSTSPVIGASASIAGLVGIYGVLAPRSRVLTANPRHVLLILGVGGTVISLVEQSVQVAVAHGSGLAFGMAAGVVWRRFNRDPAIEVS